MFLQDHYLLYLGIHSLSIYGTGDDGVLCEGVGNVNGCAISEGSDERDQRPLMVFVPPSPHLVSLLYLGIRSLSIYGTGDDGVLCEGVGNVNGSAISERSDDRDQRPLAVFVPLPLI